MPLVDASLEDSDPRDQQSDSSAGVPPTVLALPQPQMSILHLLIWVGLVAVLLGLWDLLDRLQPESVRQQIGDWTKQPISVILRTMSVAAAGAAVGGLLMFFACRQRGMAFPVQPGEWLLVLFGAIDVIDLGVYYSSLLKADRTYFTHGWYEWHYFSEHAEYFFAFGLAAYLCKCAGPWRWFFWTVTITALLSAKRATWPMVDDWQSIYTHQWLRWPSMAICAGMLAIALGSDWRNRTRRGWVHWVGVLAITLSFVEQEIWYTYVRFFRY